MERGISEFEVQAIAFITLINNLPKGYRVRGEYKFKGKDGKRGCIIDLLILKNGIPYLALEVKKNPKSRAKSQKIRYEEFLKIPCIYIKGLKQAQDVMEIVKTYIK